MTTALDQDLTKLTISELAYMIERDWSKIGKGVNFAARPYLDSMKTIDTMTDEGLWVRHARPADRILPCQRGKLSRGEGTSSQSRVEKAKLKEDSGSLSRTRPERPARVLRFSCLAFRLLVPLQ